MRARGLKKCFHVDGLIIIGWLSVKARLIIVGVALALATFTIENKLVYPSNKCTFSVSGNLANLCNPPITNLNHGLTLKLKCNPKNLPGREQGFKPTLL
jgi:hypothetical protein